MMERALSGLVIGEHFEVAVARVLLDLLERILNAAARPFQHLGEHAGVEDQRAGEFKRRIVALRGGQNRLHLSRDMGRAAADAVLAEIDQTVQRRHGDNPAVRENAFGRER